MLLSVSVCPSVLANPRPSVRSTTVTTAMVIDGRLTAAEWSGAARAQAFVQRSPTEGASPDQRSELLVRHDAGAVYFGLRLHDNDPERIRRGLGPRDTTPESDYVTLFVDPTNSRNRGYFFRVNASGVMMDGLLYDQNVMDSSWNGVWDAEAKVDDRGWTVELRVPISSLAHQDRDPQSWGIYVERLVHRTHHTSGWPAMPKSSPTFAARFGRLTGLSGMRPGSSLRLLPYLAAELQLARPDDSTRPDKLLRPNAGLDARYAFSGGSSISATVNPDFGHVEEDPAVVNLTPTEVFRAEKRPFFVEGASIFKTPITLLHTRRIGARPWAPDAADGGTIEEVDPETRIIGAAKLLGDWSRASYGLLGAVVLPSYATERAASGEAIRRRAVRGGVYGAGRVKVQLRPGVRLGGLAAGLVRYGKTLPDEDEQDDAGVAGLDWDLRSSSGWLTRGQISGATWEQGSGYGLWLLAGQQGAPRWRYWIEAESYSEDYQINSVGYLWRNEFARFKGFFQRRIPEPLWILREMYLTLWGLYGVNHDDPSLAFDRLVELSTWFMFRNRWELWTGAGHRFATLDDRETRGGPAYPRPAQTYAWFGGKTDPSLAVYAWGGASVRVETGSYRVSSDATIKAALLDRLSLSLYARYLHQRSAPRWVDTVELSTGDKVMFGDLDQDELELKVSAVLGITRDLTVSLFAQLLYSVGSYDRYRELRAFDRGGHHLVDSTVDPDADFARLSLLVNTVLRWDLGGGAAAFLVYKMSGSLDRDGHPAPFALDDDLLDFGDEEHLHLLLAKVSYGWDI